MSTQPRDSLGIVTRRVRKVMIVLCVAIAIFGLVQGLTLGTFVGWYVFVLASATASYSSWRMRHPARRSCG